MKQEAILLCSQVLYDGNVDRYFRESSALLHDVQSITWEDFDTCWSPEWVGFFSLACLGYSDKGWTPLEWYGYLHIPRPQGTSVTYVTAQGSNSDCPNKRSRSDVDSVL